MNKLLAIVALLCTPALAQFDDDVGELLGVGSAGFAPRGPSFDFNADRVGSGPSSLPALAVNGTTMTSIIDCRGEQVSGATIVCTTGGTFTEGNGGAASPSSGLAVPFTERSARGVSFSVGGKAYVAANGTVGNVTTEDSVYEFVALNPGVGYSLASSYSGVANGGWEINWPGGNAIGLVQQVPGGATFTPTSAATLVGGTWYHVMIFSDRSANTRIYVNGVLSGTPAASTTTSIASVNTVVIAGRPGSPGQTGPQALSRFTLSTCNGCLNTTAEQDAIAAQRFAQLIGISPTIAKGTMVPTISSRASSAYVDVDRDGDGNRRLFLVGNGWLRTVRRANVTGGAFHSGYLAESTATNLALQSQTFQTTWALHNADFVTADTTVAPDGTQTGDSYVADVNNVEQALSQAGIGLAATKYTLSMWAKPGNVNFLTLEDGTVGVKGYFNVATCTKGTMVGVVAQSTVDAFGGGWCRASITFTGTVASHTIKIGVTNADNTINYVGDHVTTSMVFWGAQLEAIAQTLAPTSYIATTSASVTRLGDVLTFKGSDGNVPVAGYTIAGLTQCPNDATPNAGPGLWSVSTNSNNYIEAYTDNTPHVNNTSFTGGVQQLNKGFVGDYSDGNTHETRTVYFPTFAQFYADGAAVGVAVNSITMQATPSSIELGHYSVTSGGAPGQGGCAVNRFRIFPTQRTDATVLP